MTVSNIVIVDRDRQAAHTAQTVLEKAGQNSVNLKKEFRAHDSNDTGYLGYV